MKDSLSLLGFRDFFTIEDITKRISKSDYIFKDEVIPDKNGFIFFSSKKQRTWIVCSNQCLYILLDDRSGDNLILKLRTRLDILKEKLDYLQLIPDDFKNNNYAKIKFIGIEEMFWCSLHLFQTNQDIINHIKLLIK